MKSLDLDSLREYVNTHIDEFHQAKIRSIESLKLNTLIRRKNPYLFKAKNVHLASELVMNLLDAHISSSEEELFGQFLEHVAIFIAERTCEGKRSSRIGIDLELVRHGVYTLIQIKSGPNWGNSSQQKKQEENFRLAIVDIQRELGSDAEIQAVLGICYGNTRTTRLRGYLKVVGQNFWYLISDNPQLYIQIIEPLGYQAKVHTESFELQKARVANLFTAEFTEVFCIDGVIDWEKLVHYNSGNFDLPSVLP